MAKQTHLIYISGLGDGYDSLRSRGLRLWRGKNCNVSFVPMRWRDEHETFDQKLERIRTKMDEYPNAKTVLVGESAGGSMAIVASEKWYDLVHKVITVCGKNVRADRVSPRLYASNPAFKDSMRRSDEVVRSMKPEHAARITTFYSPYDPTVPLIDTKVSGAVIKKIHIPGHVFAIFMVLFVLWGRIIREATR